MPGLEWRETARADLLAIVDYISDDNPDAAQQLKDDIEAKVANLAESFQSFIGSGAFPAHGKWSFDPTTSSFTPRTNAA